MRPPTDAQQFDAPADAPYTCPQIGTTPTFSGLYHQLLEQSCSGYTSSQRANLATVECADSYNFDVVEEGAIDGALTPSVFAASGPSPSRAPELGPDGDVMLAQDNDPLMGTTTIALYTRLNGVWSFSEDVLAVPNISEVPSEPTRGATDRRFLLYPSLTGGAFDEIVETSPGMWSNVTTHTALELDISSWNHPSLSPDGLRIVFSGSPSGTTTPRVLYADRATVDDPFHAATAISQPDADDPFLTEDCGRLYFDALETIFYVQQ